MAFHIQQMNQFASMTKEQLITEYQKQKLEDQQKNSLALRPGITPKDILNPTSCKILSLRLDSMTMNGMKYPYHRIFLQCFDSKEYYKTGWVLKQDIPVCMICQTSLQSSLFSTIKKYHCHACGNIVCFNCSNNFAIIRCIEELGDLRICRLCYFEQDSLDSYNSLLDGIPIQGRNGSFTDYIALANCDPQSKAAGVIYDQMKAKEQERVKMMERILLEREISELTMQFDDFDSADHELEENTLLGQIQLRDYGQLTIKQIYPQYVLKLFSKRYVASSKISTTTPISRTKDHIYVNICSCDDIPMAPKPISYRGDDIRNVEATKNKLSIHDIPLKTPYPSALTPNETVELFCIVFGTIIESADGFVIDCAVNSQLIEEVSINQERLGELCLQITVGVSFLRNNKNNSDPYYTDYELLHSIDGNYFTRTVNANPGFNSPTRPNDFSAANPTYSARLRGNYSSNNVISSTNQNQPKSLTASLFSEIDSSASVSPPSMIVLAIPCLDCCFALRYVYTKYSDLSPKDRTKEMNVNQLHGLLSSLKQLEKEYLAGIQTQLTTLRNRLVAGHDNHFTEIAIDNDENNNNNINNRTVKFAEIESEQKEKKRFSAIISSMKSPPLSSPKTTRSPSNEQSPTASTVTAPSLKEAHTPPVTSSGFAEISEPSDFSSESNSPISPNSDGSTPLSKKKGGKIINGMKKMLRNSILILPLSSSSASSVDHSVTAESPRTQKRTSLLKTTATPSSATDSRWYWEERGNAGHKFLTEDIFAEDAVLSADYNNLRSAADSINLKNEMIKTPSGLLGWKIAVQDADFSVKGIYVVTGMTHLFLHGLVYRISHLQTKDIWVKLNLIEGDNVHGYPFVLLEHVVSIGKK